MCQSRQHVGNLWALGKLTMFRRHWYNLDISTGLRIGNMVVENMPLIIYIDLEVLDWSIFEEAKQVKKRFFPEE